MPCQAGMVWGWGHLLLVPCWVQKAEDQCCRVGRIWEVLVVVLKLVVCWFSKEIMVAFVAILY